MAYSKTSERNSEVKRWYTFFLPLLLVSSSSHKDCGTYVMSSEAGVRGETVFRVVLEREGIVKTAESIVAADSIVFRGERIEVSPGELVIAGKVVRASAKSFNNIEVWDCP